MTKPPRSHEMPPDDPGYTEAWARDLVAAIGKREARAILEDYKRLAKDTKLSQFDRDAAKQQAKALGRLL